MVTLTGSAICDGIVFGKIFVYQRPENKIEQYKVENPAAEKNRFILARDAAVAQLDDLYAKALAKTQEKDASIFSIHQMLLQDSVYTDAVNRIIEHKHINAEAAVTLAGEQLSQMFMDIDDAYLRERSADMQDISARVVAALSRAQASIPMPDEPSILFADDLSPSETVLLCGDNALTFVTQNSSVTSHAAILARNMNIPMIVGVDGLIQDAYHGKHAVVDAFSGNIYIDPDQDTIGTLIEKADELLCADRELCLVH